MKKIGLLLVFGLIFVWGLSVGRYQVFPWYQIVWVKNVIKPMVIKPVIKPRVTLFKYFPIDSDVVMIGDSITQGGIWAEFFPNTLIANRGVGGDTTEDILRRMDTILDVSPSKALIMVGINDLHQGIEVNQIFKNYKKIIKELTSKNIDVILQSTIECSIIHCGGSILESVRDLNRMLSQYAIDNKIQYVNINKGMVSEGGGLLKQYSYDGIHLLGSGYLMWSKSISKFIL